MELYAKLYCAGRLKELAGHVGTVLGVMYANTANWNGAHKLGEMRAELTALKRQMGGGERRQFERLLAEWSRKK
jgi:hypothetical protein